MGRPWAGTGVGPFRFEARLGSGASGVVYRAVDDQGQRAAVKVLHGHLEDPDLRERFHREAQLGLEHPNVVRVLGAGFAEGDVPYIAFELLEGESVEARLARGPLPPMELVRLGRQACAGLAAAHARGIVHRDLKPANMFLTREGVLKLLDFGVALATTRATRLTRAEAIMGTPAYLSPEQARGLRDLDPRTDIWALGAILYEAASGKIPFARDTVFATLVAIRKDEVPPLAALVPGLAPGLIAAIERALMKDREGRWPSAAELDAALAGIDLAPPTRPRIAKRSQGLGESETRILAMLLAHEVRDLDALQQSVERYGGRLMTLRGERALGLFGLDAWLGDEVTRAVRAGLEARAAAGAMAVSSGPTTIAGEQIGGPALEAVKRGCRAQLAGLAIDADSARALETRLSLRFHPEGLAEITARRLPTRVMQMPRFTGASELVGRERELGDVRRELEAAAHARHASAITLSGPPGIGKSRLCQEAERLARAARPSFTIFIGHAARHQQESAFSLVRNMLGPPLRRVAGIAGDAETGFAELPLDARRRAVGALVEELGGVAHPEAGAVTEALCTLFDLGVEAGATSQAALRDTRLMLERMRAGLMGTFELALARGPVAILVEELQWADEGSLDLLDELLVSRAASPLFILATSRERALPHRPHLFAAGRHTHLALAGLAPTDVSRLVQATIGRRLPEATLRQLTQHTAGNPLFVEQIAHALASQPLAEGEELPLPLSVRAAVQSRLDGLEAAEKNLCKQAAIFDRAFFVDELEALGVREPGAALVALCQRGVLGPRGRPHPRRGQQYRFQSELMGEVAYGMLTPELRRGLHQRLAEQLAARPDVAPEEVADHFERGGMPEQAAHHYHAACARAIRVGDAKRALRWADKALALGAPAEALFSLHMARADALRFEGRPRDQAAALADALAVARDDAERARALCDEAWLRLRAGRHREAQVVAQRAERAARAAGEDEVLALALGCKVVVASRSGAHAVAERAYEEAVALASSLGPALRARAATWRAQMVRARGELGPWHAALQDALAAFEEAGDAGRAAGIAVELAYLQSRFGRYEVAIEELQGAIETCRQVGNRAMEGYGWAHLAFALAMKRRSSEALNALEESTTLARMRQDPRLALTCQVIRVRVLEGSVTPAELAALAEQAAEDAERGAEVGLQAWALALAARALRQAGALERALEMARRAMAIRDEREGLEESEAIVFAALAEALDACGHPVESDEVRARGLARIEDIAASIADPEWREDFLANVPAHELLRGLAEVF